MSTSANPSPLTADPSPVRRRRRPWRWPPLTLRAKLRLGFGGLLLILLAASGMGALVLNHYGGAFDRLFRENYNTVLYCEAMKDALDGLTEEAQRQVWDEAPPTPVRPAPVLSAPVPPAAPDAAGRWARQFDDNIALQRQNCSLPGEQQMSDAVAADWAACRVEYGRFLAATTGADRRAAYRDRLLPHVRRVWLAVQEIRGMNLRNMLDADRQVRDTLSAVRGALLVLAAGGSTLALAYVMVVGPRMLRPLSALTRSARRIADGHLDLSVEVPRANGDEIGQLAVAFNVMAGRLREFRRLDLERLARTEQTTQMAVDSLPDAVVVLSPDGRIELTNQTARDRFGLVPGAADGRRPGWMVDLHERVMRTGRRVEPQGYRSALQRFDGGDERFYLPQATPLTAADGRVLGVTAILSDVTRLKQADEAKSDLVSTVSHELKTPLTNIRMAAHLLADQDAFGPLTGPQLDLLTTAQDNTERLYRTVENLLGIGRLESGRAPLELRPIPAADVVAQAVDPMRPLFADRRVALRVPDPPPGLSVLADAQSVGHVLANLLSNALRHSPPGSAVDVGCQPDGPFVAFTVRDAGPGVEPQHVPRLFEKFYRVARPGGPAGAGLGLAIAKEIVEAHGGTVGVETEPGAGATFTFRLQATPRDEGGFPCNTAAELA